MSDITIEISQDPSTVINVGPVEETLINSLTLNEGLINHSITHISGGSDDGPSERQAAARRRVAEAMSLFGGTDTACGSCLWHGVGMECSVREWAGRQGWGGRPINHVQGQGILVAALSVLAVHYGLVPRSMVA